MDIFLIYSVNKVALLALIITFILIIFQLYFMMKRVNKNKKPAIPEFKGRKATTQFPLKQILLLLFSTTLIIAIIAILTIYLDLFK